MEVQLNNSLLTLADALHYANMELNVLNIFNRDLYINGGSRVNEKYHNSVEEILIWIKENGGNTNLASVDGSTDLAMKQLYWIKENNGGCNSLARCSDLQIARCWSEMERWIKASITKVKNEIENSKDEKKDQASKLLQSILNELFAN